MPFHYIRFVLLVLWSVIIVDSVLGAGETSLRKFPMAERVELQLQVPASWSHKTSASPMGLPATLQFQPQSGKPFLILLTPLGQSSDQSIEFLRKQAESMSKTALEQSVEKSLELTELKGESVAGFYFSATDRAPKPDEFAYLCSGIARISSSLVTFTLLTNDGQQDVVKQALTMIRSAKTAAIDLPLVQMYRVERIYAGTVRGGERPSSGAGAAQRLYTLESERAAPVCCSAWFGVPLLFVTKRPRLKSCPCGRARG